jgi:hypothetical protein
MKGLIFFLSINTPFLVVPGSMPPTSQISATMDPCKSTSLQGLDDGTYFEVDSTPPSSDLILFETSINSSLLQLKQHSLKPRHLLKKKKKEITPFHHNAYFVKPMAGMEIRNSQAQPSYLCFLVHFPASSKKDRKSETS